MVALRRIAAEWNRNAALRCTQLDARLDISHDEVLVPAILRLAGNLKGKHVLDAGCGCGFVTRTVARQADEIVGVDISKKMIEEAKRRSHGVDNVRFQVASIEAFARHNKRRFDTCLSNMSLMTMPYLARALYAMALTLKPGGDLVFSIAHPCFWNFYRRDEPKTSFNYWKPHAVVAPFRITLDQEPLPVPTTYFHRSLSEYVSAIRHVGLELEQLVEPPAPKKSPARYRRTYRFPRFLVFLARKLT